MKIVKMKSAHLPAVTKLTNQLGYPSTSKAIQRRFKRLQKLKSRGLFVAIQEDVILGWIDLDMIHSFLHDPRAEIRALVVDQDHHGQGIGKALVTQAKRWTKARKLKSIFLRTNIRRRGAHRFYEHLGFKKTKTSYKYEF